MRVYFMNTRVQAVCAMENVTDADILEWSNGEVDRALIYPDEENDDGELPSQNAIDRSFCSDKIFGSYKEESLKMGHIELPVPVVNVNYYRGTRPVLASKLHLPMNTVNDIIFYRSCVCVKDNEKDKAGEITACHPLEDMGPDYLLGGAAIEWLLKDDLDKDKIILHRVPVIPAALRYCTDSDGEMLAYKINWLYRKVLLNAHMAKRQEEMKAKADRYPECLLSSDRARLQKSVDALINNGCTSVDCDYWGMPRESFAEMRAVIADGSSEYFTMRREPVHVNADFDYDAFLTTVNKLHGTAGCVLDDRYGNMISNPPDDMTIDEIQGMYDKCVACFDPIIKEIVDTKLPDFAGNEKVYDVCRVHVFYCILDRIGENGEWDKTVTREMVCDLINMIQTGLYQTAWLFVRNAVMFE